MEVTWESKTVEQGKPLPNFPSWNGIYVIAEITGPKLVRVRYVGKGNIAERIADHTSGTDRNKCMIELMRTKVKVKYAKIDSTTKRSDAEHSLYDIYAKRHKLCNEKVPDGDKITINLPYARRRP